MSLTTEEVDVCNQSLGRIGSTTFTFAVQTSDEAVKCDLFYTQTRKELLRSFEWNFASRRQILVAETTAPDFEWDYRYRLPTDFLRVRGIYSDYDLVIEGDYLLTNDNGVELKYVKNVELPEEFDPLFTEVLILKLAKKLINTLAGTGTVALKEEVERELINANGRARAINRIESDNKGRSDWNEARYGSGKV